MEGAPLTKLLCGPAPQHDRPVLARESIALTPSAESAENGSGTQGRGMSDDYPVKLEYPLVRDTLGKHAASGHGITAHCDAPGCHASLKLDLATLIWTRGLDFPGMRLASRLRCPMCGSRNVSIRVAAWTKLTPAEPVPLTDMQRARRAEQRKTKPIE